MSASFYNADKHTHRRIMLVGLMFLRGLCRDQLFWPRRSLKTTPPSEGGQARSDRRQPTVAN